MRIALFSDVHGNLTALEATLQQIDSLGYDLLIFVGDLCLFGPRPAECLQIIRDRRIPCVFGNTDEGILGRLQLPKQHDALVAWTAAQLSAAEKTWLGNLPFSVSVNPTADPHTELRVVHANPHDVNRFIFPTEDVQLALAGEIRQTDAQLAALLVGLEAGALAYGHLHIPSVRQFEGHLLANISSVSRPLDGDPRAKFAILTWGGAGWSAEHIHVPYDIDREIAAFRQVRPPDWQEAVALFESYKTMR